jgi:hypothetical protein
MRDGLLLEFEEPEQLLAAVRQLRARGFARLETFTPYPIRDVQEALELPRSRVPPWVLAGGLLGASSAFLLQWWMNGFDYPLDVGGRPLESFPAFIPVTFELGVLGASTAAFLALLAYAGLPRLWHPVFDVDGFERSAVDRFFLLIGRSDPRFDEDELARLLEHGAVRMVRLPLRREA